MVLLLQLGDSVLQAGNPRSSKRPSVRPVLHTAPHTHSALPRCPGPALLEICRYGFADPP
jgi:hypothetical protein